MKACGACRKRGVPAVFKRTSDAKRAARAVVGGSGGSGAGGALPLPNMPSLKNVEAGSKGETRLR